MSKINIFVNDTVNIKNAKIKKNLSEGAYNGVNCENWKRKSVEWKSIPDILKIDGHSVRLIDANTKGSNGEWLSPGKRENTELVHGFPGDVDMFGPSEFQGVPPNTLQELISKIPAPFCNYIYWAGHSSSSFSKRKPWLCARFLFKFEKPLTSEEFDYVIEKLIHGYFKYVPGIDLRLKDPTRIAYGNSNPEHRNQDILLGNVIPAEILDKYIEQGRNEKFAREAEQERKRLAYQVKREENKAKYEQNEIPPWEAVLQTEDPTLYLESLGYTDLNSVGDGFKRFSRPDGDKGKPSLGLRTDTEVPIIAILSTSISLPPSADTSISFLAFFVWNKYHLDIVGGASGPNRSNFLLAMQHLADDGYGQWNKQIKKNIQDEAAQQELETPHWDNDKNELEHTFIINREYYTEPKGNPEVLEIIKPFKMALLEGPPGTGKTTLQLRDAINFKEKDPDNLKIVVTPRKVLTANISHYFNEKMGKFEIDGYNLQMPSKYNHGDIDISNDNWIPPSLIMTTTINSLINTISNLDEDFLDFSITLDEIDFIIRSLADEGMRAHADKICVLLADIATRHTIICTGATCSTQMFRSFANYLGFSEDEICQVKINKKVNNINEVHFAEMKKGEQIVDSVASLIKKGKEEDPNRRFLVACSHKNDVDTLQNHRVISKLGVVKTIHSDNSMLVDTKRLAEKDTLEDMEADILIISPSVDVGMNLYGENTQVIVIQKGIMGGDPRTSWQQARRVRNTKLPIVYIYQNIDWKVSAPLNEKILIEMQVVLDDFLLIDTHKNNKFKLMYETAEKTIRDDDIYQTIENIYKHPFWSDAQKEFLRKNLAKSKMAAISKYEKSREEYHHLHFIVFHAKREGYNTKIIEIPTPDDAEIKLTKEINKQQKEQRKELTNLYVQQSISVNDLSSLEIKDEDPEIVVRSKKDARTEIRKNSKALGITLPKEISNTKLSERDWAAINKLNSITKIKGTSMKKVEYFNTKYNNWLWYKDKKKAKNKYVEDAMIDLVHCNKSIVHHQLTKVIIEHFRGLEPLTSQEVYDQCLQLAKMKIDIFDGMHLCDRELSHLIFSFFPGVRDSYLASRQRNQTQGKALFTVFSSIIKKYTLYQFRGKNINSRQHTKLMPDPARQEIIEMFDYKYENEIVDTDTDIDNTYLDGINDNNNIINEIDL